MTTGQIKSRLEKLEARATVNIQRWRRVIWHPDREPMPVAAEGERLIIREIIPSPYRQQGDDA